MNAMVKNPLYRAISALLDYPDASLRAALPEIGALVAASAELSDPERASLLGVLSWMENLDPLDLEAVYVQTFDLTPEHDLHLTYHLFEEGDRERGPAMIHLAEHYESYGLATVGKELPDYLPLILEYAATLDDDEAKVFLGSAAHAIETLTENLEKIQSPYAPLLRFALQRGRLAEIGTTNSTM